MKLKAKKIQTAEVEQRERSQPDIRQIIVMTGASFRWQAMIGKATDINKTTKVSLLSASAE